MQLEEELRLRRVEIEDLQAKVRGTDRTSSNGEVAPGQPEDQVLLEAGDREKGEEALALCRQEVDSLRAALDSKNQEISDLKQKVQHATKENMDMMDTWKVKTDTHTARGWNVHLWHFVADDSFQLNSIVCLAFLHQLVGAKYQTNQHISIPFNLTKKINHLLVPTFDIPEIVYPGISELLINWRLDLKLC